MNKEPLTSWSPKARAIFEQYFALATEKEKLFHNFDQVLFDLGINPDDVFKIFIAYNKALGRNQSDAEKKSSA